MNILNEIEMSFLDYPDSSSHAMLIYMAGCDFNCKNCHNSEMRNYEASNCTAMGPNELFAEIKKTAERNRTDKVVLEGGDPLSHWNIEETKALLKLLKQGGYKTMIYTGNTVEFCKENEIKDFEFLKCGEYKEDLKQESEKTDILMTFASTNQKLYDKDYKLLTKDGIYNYSEEKEGEK